jgi:hypothetical protein
MVSDNQYIHGFDYLRIIFAIFVITWHIRIFGNTGIFLPQISNFTPSFLDIIYANILLLAVPIFMLVSLFLYGYNRNKIDGYFRKRITYLGWLYIFWYFAALIVFGKGISVSSLLSIQSLSSGFGTPVYFLFDLILMTIILECLILLKGYTSEKTYILLNSILFIIFIILITFSLPISYFFGKEYNWLFLAFYSPINFLPYPFLASLLIIFFNRIRTITMKWISLLFTMMICLIILEWAFLVNSVLYNSYHIIVPPYARPSLIVGSLILFILFSRITKESSVIIKNLSSLTLGVYLIHIYIWKLLPNIVPELPALIQSNVLMIFFIVIISSFGVTYWIKKVGIV